MDNPSKYGWSRTPIPYSMGFALSLLWIALVLFVTWPVSGSLAVLLLAVFGLSLLGILDDFYNIKPWIRILVQAALVIALIAAGFRLESFTNFLSSEVVFLPELGAVITFFWIMFLINSMNFLDGIPALTSGVSSVALVFLLFLAQIPNFHLIDQAEFIEIGLITLPIWVASFVFEFPWRFPKFLPGDSGATVMGLLLAVFSIMAGGKLAILTLVLLLPLLDVLFVLGRRFLQGRALWKGDYRKDHLHHILRYKGVPIAMIVIIYLILSSVFGVLALHLWTASTKLLALGFLSIVLFLGLILMYKSNGFSCRN